MSQDAEPFDTGIMTPSPIGGIAGASHELPQPADPRMLAKLNEEYTYAMPTLEELQKKYPGQRGVPRMDAPCRFPTMYGPYLSDKEADMREAKRIADHFIEQRRNDKENIDKITKQLLKLKAEKEAKDKHAGHIREIPKGKTGEFSKLIEEFEEARDAFEQGLPLMCLWELTDFLGALIVFLEKNYPGISVDNLLAQARHTNELFAKRLRIDRDPK